MGYSLATYDNYVAVGESLRAMGTAQWLAMAACVALMPINMLVEAWRWRTLMPMTMREAQRQVYYSKLAGLLTPWRLGEYPARAVLMTGDEWSGNGSGLMSRVLGMGAVGSATMTAAIIVMGVAGLFFCPSVLAQLGHSYLYALCGITLVLAVCLYFAPQWLKKYAEVNTHLLFSSFWQSVVRVSCWCIQLWLVLFALNAFGTRTGGSLLPLLPVYYLLVTVTPNIPVVEAGVRGAWAMFLFGSLNAALAGVVLWAVNTLLPCLAWLFIRKDK